jgi:hypothetical protein
MNDIIYTFLACMTIYYQTINHCEDIIIKKYGPKELLTQTFRVYAMVWIGVAIGYYIFSLEFARENFKYGVFLTLAAVCVSIATPYAIFRIRKLVEGL